MVGGGGLVLEDIAAVAPDLLRVERLGDIGLDDHGTAGAVDQDGVGPHLGQRRGVDHPPGAGVEWDVKCDVLGRREQLVEADSPGAGAGLGLGGAAMMS